ncbi:sugar phosphate nucleotidyltransferase [Edaphobacter aggregans]|uniref:sugar phosphate nucleotidyltransferase n=1 Tax=Edaphobacter aggregans TaxID=570835 RepID=UPI000A00D885
MLAGGDGTRLQSLTLKIAGDSRPKQFCSIVGRESLLAQTRARIESLIHVDRELFVVTRAHESYYREELRDVDDSRIISQPLNRGTGVAAAIALLHILQRDADAVVIFVRVITTTPTLRHAAEPSGRLYLAPNNIRIRSFLWVPRPTIRKSNTDG